MYVGFALKLSVLLTKQTYFKFFHQEQIFIQQFYAECTLLWTDFVLPRDRDGFGVFIDATIGANGVSVNRL